MIRIKQTHICRTRPLPPPKENDSAGFKQPKGGRSKRDGTPHIQTTPNKQNSTTAREREVLNEPNHHENTEDRRGKTNKKSYHHKNSDSDLNYSGADGRRRSSHHHHKNDLDERSVDLESFRERRKKK
jgi:hypothetical protein